MCAFSQGFHLVKMLDYDYLCVTLIFTIFETVYAILPIDSDFKFPYIKGCLFLCSKKICLYFSDTKIYVFCSHKGFFTLFLPCLYLRQSCCRLIREIKFFSVPLVLIQHERKRRISPIRSVQKECHTVWSLGRLIA